MGRLMSYELGVQVTGTVIALLIITIAFLAGAPKSVLLIMGIVFLLLLPAYTGAAISQKAQYIMNKYGLGQFTKSTYEKTRDADRNAPDEGPL